jgi:hypothetical protein
VVIARVPQLPDGTVSAPVAHGFSNGDPHAPNLVAPGCAFSRITRVRHLAP